MVAGTVRGRGVGGGGGGRGGEMGGGTDTLRCRVGVKRGNKAADLRRTTSVKVQSPCFAVSVI